MSKTKTPTEKVDVSRMKAKEQNTVPIGDYDLAVCDLCAAIISLIERKADEASVASAWETIKEYCP